MMGVKRRVTDSVEAKLNYSLKYPRANQYTFLQVRQQGKTPRELRARHAGHKCDTGGRGVADRSARRPALRSPRSAAHLPLCPMLNYLVV